MTYRFKLACFQKFRCEDFCHLRLFTSFDLASYNIFSIWCPLGDTQSQFVFQFSWILEGCHKYAGSLAGKKLIVDCFTIHHAFYMPPETKRKHI